MQPQQAPVPQPGVSNPPLPLEALSSPAAISWWPPAPGWWILLLLCLLLLAALIYAGWRYIHQQRDRRQAQQLLRQAYLSWQKQRDDQQLLQQCNQILKRYCRQRFPSALALHGEQWLTFLNQSAGQPVFTKPLADALTHGLYCQPQQLPDLDGTALHQSCQRWLRRAAAKHLAEAN